MKQTIFKGSGVAIITPMLEDGSVNYPVLKELLEQQIAGGTDAIVICGTTGEASALNDTEHLDVIEFACATVNRRLPVIAGTGSNDTRHAVALSREAKKPWRRRFAAGDALLQQNQPGGSCTAFQCGGGRRRSADDPLQCAFAHRYEYSA